MKGVPSLKLRASSHLKNGLGLGLLAGTMSVSMCVTSFWGGIKYHSQTLNVAGIFTYIYSLSYPNECLGLYISIPCCIASIPLFSLCIII